MAPLAKPLDTTVARLPTLPTLTVALLSSTVGVSLAWVTLLATLAE